MQADFFANNRHLGTGQFRASICGVYHYRCQACDREFLTEVFSGADGYPAHKYLNSWCWTHRDPSHPAWPIASGLPAHWLMGHLDDLLQVPHSVLLCTVRHAFDNYDWSLQNE